MQKYFIKPDLYIRVLSEGKLTQQEAVKEVQLFFSKEVFPQLLKFEHSEEYNKPRSKTRRTKSTVPMLEFSFANLLDLMKETGKVK